MNTVSIRGATTVVENTREEILSRTKELLSEILSENKISTESIISVIFTATKDLDAVYPAVSAREIGITQASLMCVQEMFVVGSLEKCIRVMLTTESYLKQKDVTHVYLREAEKLRPDLKR